MGRIELMALMMWADPGLGSTPKFLTIIASISLFILTLDSRTLDFFVAGPPLDSAASLGLFSPFVAPALLVFPLLVLAVE